MSDSTSFSVVALPPELEAGQMLACRDQMGARIDLVAPPKDDDSKKKKKKSQEEPETVLPPGVVQMEALPEQIALPWKRFLVAAAALEKLRAERAAAQADEAHTADDETEQDLANTHSDDRWRAFEAWNSGACRLDDDGEGPSPTQARWLYAQLFPAKDGGLRFITRGWRLQWAAMVPKMEVLAGETAQAVINGFGGARHYKQLVESHKRYGKAFGFSTVVIEPVGGPTDGRPQWTTARDAFRTVIQKIEGYADPQIAGSEPLANFLLKPFADMVEDLQKARRIARKKAEPAAPVPVPAAEPTHPKPPKG